MSTINGILKVQSALLLALLIIGCNQVQATSDEVILFIKCNGESSIVKGSKETSFNKQSLGDVARGLMLQDVFYYFDGLNLNASNLSTNKTRTVVDLKGTIEADHKVWQVGNVSAEYIYFSAQKYEKDVPITKQNKLSAI